MLIERIAFWRNQGSIRLAVRVLELRCTSLQEGAQIIAVLLSRILPVRANRIPALAQTFLIRIAVLRDQRGDTLGPRHCQAEAHRRAVVEDIDRIAIQADSIRERLNDFGKMVKRVTETLCIGGI